jgi:transposase-like protein
MHCPICKNTETQEIDLHVDGFYEDIHQCSCCGSSWSISHGKAEVVFDAQEKSFLEGVTECVESDDYCWAA